MAPPNESGSNEQADKKRPSALRDALMRSGAGDEGGASRHVSPSNSGWIPPADKGGLNREITLFGPGYLDLALFCRQFAMLTEVGISVFRALQMIARRTHHPKLRNAIEDTAHGVEGGQSIHQAMAPHINVFSPLIINIIRVGELGGILEDSLVRLAEIMESKCKI